MSLDLSEMLKLREGGECGDEGLKLQIQILTEPITSTWLF